MAPSVCTVLAALAGANKLAKVGARGALAAPQSLPAQVAEVGSARPAAWQGCCVKDDTLPGKTLGSEQARVSRSGWWLSQLRDREAGLRVALIRVRDAWT